MRRTLSFVIAIGIIATLAGDALAATFEEGMEALTRRDFPTALEIFRPLADQGRADAQNVLAGMYFAGYGVPPDLPFSQELYRKAAQQGNASAQYNLGRMYLDAQGVARDYQVAAEWFHKAAGQGQADALEALARLYQRGNGVPQDLVIAFALLTVKGRNEPDQDNPEVAWRYQMAVTPAIVAAGKILAQQLMQPDSRLKPLDQASLMAGAKTATLQASAGNLSWQQWQGASYIKWRVEDPQFKAEPSARDWERIRNLPPGLVEISRVSYLPVFSEIPAIASLAAEQTRDDPSAIAMLKALETSGRKLAELAAKRPKEYAYIAKLGDERGHINFLFDTILRQGVSGLRASREMVAAVSKALADMEALVPKGALWDESLKFADALMAVQANEAANSIWNWDARAALAVLLDARSVAEARTVLAAARSVQASRAEYSPPAATARLVGLGKPVDPAPSRSGFYMGSLGSIASSLRAAGNYIPAPPQSGADEKNAETEEVDAARSALVGSLTGTLGCGTNRRIEITMQEQPTILVDSLSIHGDIRMSATAEPPRSGSPVDGDAAVLASDITATYSGSIDLPSGFVTLRVSIIIDRAPPASTSSTKESVKKKLSQVADLLGGSRSKSKATPATANNRKVVTLIIRLARDLSGSGVAGTLDTGILGCNLLAVARSDGTPSAKLPPLDAAFARSLAAYAKTQDQKRYWLDLSAQQGDTVAAIELARDFEAPSGGKPDMPRAIHYYQLASKFNSAEGQLGLIRLSGSAMSAPMDPKEKERLQAIASKTLVDTFNWCASPKVVESMRGIIQANLDSPRDLAEAMNAGLRSVGSTLTSTQVDKGKISIARIEPAGAAGLDRPFQCKVTYKLPDARVTSTAKSERWSWQDPQGIWHYGDNSGTVESSKTAAALDEFVLTQGATVEPVDVQPLGDKRFRLTSKGYLDEVQVP